MNTVDFQSNPLTDEIIYSGDINELELEQEWFVLYKSSSSQYYARGFENKEEAVRSLLIEFITPAAMWKVHGLYHKKKPQDFELEIKL